jgi:hypothetical protein
MPDEWRLDAMFTSEKVTRICRASRIHPICLNLNQRNIPHAGESSPVTRMPGERGASGWQLATRGNVCEGIHDGLERRHRHCRC